MFLSGMRVKNFNFPGEIHRYGYRYKIFFHLPKEGTKWNCKIYRGRGGGGGSGVSLNSPNKSWCQHSWKLSYTALQQTLNSLCENERKYLHHKNLNIAWAWIFNLAIKIYWKKKYLEMVLASTKFPEIWKFPEIPHPCFMFKSNLIVLKFG